MFLPDAVKGRERIDPQGRCLLRWSEVDQGEIEMGNSWERKEVVCR